MQLIIIDPDMKRFVVEQWTCIQPKRTFSERHKKRCIRYI